MFADSQEQLLEFLDEHTVEALGDEDSCEEEITLAPRHFATVDIRELLAADVAELNG